jgi:hypothetical protein
MRVGFDAIVYCPCGLAVGPIQLPTSTLGSLNQNPEGPIPMIDQLYVACPNCKLVSDYSRRVDLQILGIANLPKIPERRLAIRVRGECGAENCGSRITIHTTVNADIPKPEQRHALETKSAQWEYSYSVRCAKGHYLAQAGLINCKFEGIEPESAQ